MLLTEILNLYNLSANPDQLQGHELIKGAKYKGKEIKIPVTIGKSSIVFPFGKVISIPTQTNDLAKKLVKADGDIIDSWEGNPEQFTWDKLPVQQKHYSTLKKILARNGLKFDHMWYCVRIMWDRYKRKNIVMHWLIVVSGDPSNANFVWYKYAGHTPTAGQNWVYPGGTKMQTSDFLSFTPKIQDLVMNAAPASDTSKWLVRYSIWGNLGRDQKGSINIISRTKIGAQREVKQKLKAKYGDRSMYVFDPLRIG